MSEDTCGRRKDVPLFQKTQIIGAHQENKTTETARTLKLAAVDHQLRRKECGWKNVSIHLLNVWWNLITVNQHQ